jgi:hypothetical protein
MPYVPDHTHTFELPTASPADVAAGISDELVVTPASLVGFAGGGGGGSSALLYREVTAAGDITVVANDDIIGVNKTVGAATNVNLPAAADRISAGSARPLIIKDVKGDADSNNITPVPDGSETIDGLSGADWAIVSPRDSLKLYPVSGGWITIP